MQLRTSMLAVATAALFLACGPGKPPNVADSGPATQIPGPTCLDNDGDGVPGTGDCTGVAVVDCNDRDPAIHPSAVEVCNGIDDNCDGQIDEGLTINTYYKDSDGDGYGTSEVTGSGCAPAPAGSATKTGDCNDAAPAVHPGATEVCNAVDDDCNGQVDDTVLFQDFYPDLDGDGYGDALATPEHSCQLTIQGKVPNHGDCNDHDPVIRPGAIELCNKIDDNCDGLVDNGVTYSDYYPDNDGDGYGDAVAAPESACMPVPGKVLSHTDCNDANPSVHPGAPEVCNGVDDNCNGTADEGLTFANYYPDSDADGFGAATAVAVNSCKPLAGKVTNNGDCDDTNGAVHPGATEVCNGVDDNCNAQTDEGLTFLTYYADGDGDGYGDSTGTGVSSCKPIVGKVSNYGDCNDGNPAIHPGATELCNNVDDNCNGQTDEGLTFANYYPDGDGDGFGSSTATVQRWCLPVTGKVTNNTDCDDGVFAVHPGAVEVCNGRDDNCDGQIDEGLTFLSYYPDGDGDGFGSSSAAAVVACAAPAGKVTDHTDCDDTVAYIHPGAIELCNGKDDNCDGLIDNGVVTQNYYPDTDLDGFGAAGSSAQASCSAVPGKVTNNTDCNDGNGAIHPGAAEVCNGVDDNCNAQIDEGLTFLSYYPDLDSDGYGAAGALAESSCKPVAGKVSNNSDCNDNNTQVHPGVVEVCNSVDDNCNGQIDEGLTFVNYYPDADFDTYGSATAAAESSCKPVPGKVTSHTDCNDGNASIHPGAAEVCNNVDDNCNGVVDEGNPGGGASCVTGQVGVCSAGTLSCQTGVLTCLRNVAPSPEVCDGLDNDCNNQVDETFPNKGQACTAGLGVCLNPGSYLCTADKTATYCSAVAGSPTPAACDGLDNDCDGVADEPFISSTTNITTVAWQDIEFAPYYYSPAGCAGGLYGGSTDALAGGALAMAQGLGGIVIQPLNSSGDPTGTTTSATGLTYSDVAIAQAGDGFLIAGIWAYGPEIDLYYMSSTGAYRVELQSQFNAGAGNSIDSLRVVRGNGKRVVLVWREVIASPAATRLRMARVEPCYSGSAWSLGNPGCVAAPITSIALPVASTVMAGVGADSTHLDWGASQTCPTASSLRTVAVAYLSSAASLNYFTMNEDGSGKGAETVVRTVSGTQTLAEPEVAYFNSAGDQWFVGYVTPDTGTPAQADLDFWLSTSPSWHYAYLQYATDNGAASIRRPRATVSSTGIFMSALRYVPDASGFKRQIMTRWSDFGGLKVPSTSLVELSATSGACGADPACRPGDKDGLASWGAKGKLYYSGSGSTLTGSFASSLTCQ